MIQIDENYVIEVDQYNYISKFDRHRVYVDKKTGVETEVYDIVGHYSNLDNALEGILNDMIRRRLQDNDCNLKSALKVVRECHRRFTDVMNRVLREEKKHG